MNLRPLVTILSLVMLVLGLMIAPVAAQEGTIVDVAAGNEDFSTLVQAVTAAGLGETLAGEGPFTVFAPTNDAFAIALEELDFTAADLISNPDLLTAVLTYHVVAAEVFSTDLSDGQVVETVNGATFTVNIGEDGTVTLTDGMERTISVTAVDIEASNGVIHVIDNVLLPPMEAAAEEDAAAGTIVDVAASNADFSTLVQAVTAAGLGETLAGEGPFTVFAPTNDAFAVALEELGLTAEDLVGNLDLLTAVLTYHVVAAEVFSTDLSDGQVVETVNGATFTVNIGEDGTVTLTDGMERTITVVAVDIEASNGVIHVIDNVLLPPMEAAAEEPAEEEMMEDPGYGVPEGYDVEEPGTSIGNVTLTSGDETIIVVSPEAYAQVLSTQEFETDLEELSFFLDRTGYNVGLEQETLPTGASLGVGVSVTRLGQSGVAYLYDLGRETFPVISLHTGRGRVGAPPADVETVVSEFEFLGTIVDIAIENAEGGNADRAGLSYLVAAVQAADPAVIETLSGEGNFTVFAPTNQAFINLFAFLESNYGLSPTQVLASQDVLTSVLLYHVVEGDVFAEDVLGLTAGSNVPTLLEDPQNGIVVGFRGDGSPILNGAVDLVATDILASNGVIHIIDDVLIPQCVVDTLEGTGTCGNFGE